jgi:hypothetical protein
MKSLTISLLACATAVFAAPGDGAWAAAYSKARTALAQLSNTQKVGLATGVGWQKGGCVGNIAPISSIGFPELCLQDSPLGYVHLNESCPLNAYLLISAKREIRPGSYGVPGGDHDRLNLGYRVDVCQGQCTGYDLQ